MLGAFALNLTRLWRRVTQQMVLPGRRRPGNLLSSLFLLFTGLAEDVIALRRALIGIPLVAHFKLPARDRLDAAWAYSKRYLRLGVIAVAWVLFILSSLEWSRPADAFAPSPTVTATAIKKADTTVVVAASDAPLLREATVTSDQPVFFLTTWRAVLIRRWLRLCTIRI